MRTATDDAERKVLDDIAAFGWHCVKILPEEGQLTWAFSVGLYETWGYPELIVVGLDGDVAHRMIALVADGLARGVRPDPAAPADDLVVGHACHFVEVARHHCAEHVGFAMWFYAGTDFPLCQIVWPSSAGHYPWDPLATERFRAIQPLLGHPPTVA